MNSVPSKDPFSRPGVTVLMAVYNGAQTLERALQSILDQTYPNIYILCIDDASTDGSLSILEAWQEKFNGRLQIIRNEANTGLTLSLNKGIDAVATPLIARLDADDWWEPTKLEKQVAFLEAHPNYGVVGTNYINHAPRHEIAVTVPETDAVIRKNIFWHNPFAHSAVMYRTDLIRKMGKYNPTVRYAQDYELWIRTYRETKFYNLQESLCHRTLGESISTERQNEQMRQYLKVLRTYLPLHQRPIFDYAAMLEPLIVLAFPEPLKKLKRKYFP